MWTGEGGGSEQITNGGSDIVKAKAGDLKRKRDEKVIRFAASHPHLSIREIGRRTKVSKSTVDRILRAAPQAAPEVSQTGGRAGMGQQPSSTSQAENTAKDAPATPSRNRTSDVGHADEMTKEQEALITDLYGGWLKRAKKVSKRLLKDREVVRDPFQRAEREAGIFVILTLGLIGYWLGAKVNLPVGYGGSAKVEFSLQLSDLSKALRRFFIDIPTGTAGNEARRP